MRERELLVQTHTKVQFLTEAEMPLADFDLDDAIAKQIKDKLPDIDPKLLFVTVASYESGWVQTKSILFVANSHPSVKTLPTLGVTFKVR